MIAVIESARIAILAQEALALGLDIIHVWTDSITVLSWIIKPSTRPTNHIRQKLDKLTVLKKKFETVTHHYVPTEVNRADIASPCINLLRDGDDCIQLWLTGHLF